MPAMIAVSPEVVSWDAATSVGTFTLKGKGYLHLLQAYVWELLQQNGSTLV